MYYDKINPKFQNLEIDHLYHLGIDTSLDLKRIFGKIRYVVMSDSNDNISVFAKEFAKSWYSVQESDFEFKPIFKTERFHLYKIGPILIVSHGIGMPSMLICLNEITKLLFHAKCIDVAFLKFSHSGGIGVPGGTIIITTQAVNNKLEPIFSNIESGEEVFYSTLFDHELSQSILTYGLNHGYKVDVGKTMGTYGFYEEQARLDGALEVIYTKEEREEYLRKAQLNGVKSINMVALAFAAFCHHLGIPAAMVSLVLVDRLISDKTILPDNEKLMTRDVIKLLVNYLVTDLKNYTE